MTTHHDTAAYIILMNITVSISLDESLLADMDKLAKREHRSRSELLREAARLYIQRRDRGDKIFAWDDASAKERRLSEQDVATGIQADRKSKAVQRGQEGEP